eukprot:265978_1
MTEATELPISTYTWKLDTTKAIELTESDGKYFKSPLFKMHGFKWYLQFYRNCKNKQFVGLYIFLHSLPPIISKIVMERKFHLLETNTVVPHTDTFVKGTKIWGWGTSSLQTNLIENIARFTIKTEMTLTDVFDSNGKDITEQYINPTEQKSETIVSINDGKYQEHEIRLNSLTTQMDQMMKSITKMEN